ncbi:Retrovirus-related Pol polyprotein from transposon TNT 1-94 [Cucumis melo var. makuwa]|uniref:Retrovirus-related Pol polyprotein from transposon TNT 1-94 n=1 Tax=Cucumis melo var. makuwa TaxID=1194695 RepID=A0A5A7UGG6_CUCMM|nr:Retrovirus-related Pol polyprotein from transposon TNT 1-94 [Cucumis melo var. makuwa]
MVNGLPQIEVPTEVCEDCIVSKQHRDPFPTGKSWRAKRPLELVHSDLCAPTTLKLLLLLGAIKCKLRKKLAAKSKFFAQNVESQKPTKRDQLGSTNGLVNPPSLSTTSDNEERSQRTKRKPAWMTDYEVTEIDEFDDPLTYFALFSDCDPTVFKEVIKDPKWQRAMDEEIEAIEQNNTWELTDLPKGHKIIGIKWVYKTKLKENDKVKKYKACLVVKGYKQEFGVNYKEVFAPVARHDTIRLVVSLAAQNSWPIFQLDVKSTFLHGELQEKVFVDQPLDYVKVKDEHKVYRLKKALYRLKQAP